MNWEAAGAIAEILGVIAVIGSLIYVGRQINQNTQIARANIVHETATLSNQVFQLIAQDSELADIFGRGTTGVSLNGVDLQRFTALVTMYMTWLEDIDSQSTAKFSKTQPALQPGSWANLDPYSRSPSG